VVLPFTNLSGDPSQDYFADGITENLTTDLSRIRNSFVIARNTAFTFRGKNIDSKEISKELGVRYVLEGSVQRDQNRVRVNVQLIDGETGAHLWADRFEESVTDLFKLQDQVVARLANSLGHELVKAEAQRSTHSTNPDAIDLTMRGWAFLWQPSRTKESVASAREYFERAIKLDPQNPEAMVGLAYARIRANFYGWSTADEDTPAAQMDLLAKATAINPGYAFAYYVKSTALFYTKQVSEAFEAAQTAVTLDANAAYGYYAMGRAETAIGRCGQSIAHLKQAFV
jgi:TolB-like protein